MTLPSFSVFNCDDSAVYGSDVCRSPSASSYRPTDVECHLNLLGYCMAGGAGGRLHCPVSRPNYRVSFSGCGKLCGYNFLLPQILQFTETRFLFFQ